MSRTNDASVSPLALAAVTLTADEAAEAAAYALDVARVALQARIDAQWASKSIKTDWLGLETLQRDIFKQYTATLEAGGDVDQAALYLAMIGEALAAFTRRGTP